MSIRDILVTAIVLGTLPFVLRHAYIGVLLWTWLSVMNPHKLAWGFATQMPFAAMAAGATLLSLITTRDKVRLPLAPPVLLLTVFLIWVSLTTALALDPGLSLIELERVFKIQLMTLVAAAVLHEKKELELFVWINVLSLGFFGAKGGIFTIATGGDFRVWGPGGFIGGNNEIALALIIAIPLMYYLWLVQENAWIRRGLLAMMILCAVAAIGSHSRGALLAIAAMVAFLWWRSPKKLAYGAPMALAAVLMLLFMPEHWVSRMETITEYQSDASAMGRLNAWAVMINIANDRLTGGGFDIYNRETFAIYAPAGLAPIAAHSIYFQVLGEHGWIGLLLFLALWMLSWRTATSIRRQSRDKPDLAWAFQLAGMSQVSLVGYAVGGAFLSLAYFDLPYNILVILVVLQRWLSARVAEAPDAALPEAHRREHEVNTGEVRAADR